MPLHDHLRWYMGYVIIYASFIAALIALITVKREVKVRKLTKYYLISYLISPIFCGIVSLFCGLAGLVVFVIGHMTFVPQSKVADNDEYIIRTAPITMNRYTPDRIYRKSGIFERLVGEINMEHSLNSGGKTIDSFCIMDDKIHIMYRASDGADSLMVYYIEYQ